MEDLDKRMAELSSSGRIDPAFLQISAKAYGAARDTNMSKDEAKWVAYKLYRHVSTGREGAGMGREGRGAGGERRARAGGEGGARIALAITGNC